MFHAACRLVADCFVGTGGPRDRMRAWRQAYRAVEHGHAKGRCATRKVMERFPPDIQNFASTFVDLQVRRHEADYDPSCLLSRSGVMADIDSAELAIRDLGHCTAPDRRAFAVWVTLKDRRDG